MGLTRARAITGSIDFRQKINILCQDILSKKADFFTVMSGLRDMRRRLAETKLQRGLWDIKRGPGGLQDIELFGQGVALVQNCRELTTVAQLYSGQNAVFFMAADINELARSHDWLSDLRLLHRLMCGTDNHNASFGEGGRARLLRITQFDSDSNFEHVVVSRCMECAKIIDRILCEIKR